MREDKRTELFVKEGGNHIGAWGSFFKKPHNLATPDCLNNDVTIKSLMSKIAILLLKWIESAMGRIIRVQAFGIKKTDQILLPEIHTSKGRTP